MEDVKEMGTTLKLWRSAMRGVLVSNAISSKVPVLNMRDKRAV